MSDRFRRLTHILPFILITIFILGSHQFFKKEELNIVQKINSKLSNKSNSLREYFLNSISLAISLKDKMEDSLNILDIEDINHPTFKNITYNKDKNLFKIINDYGNETQISSCLVGIGKIEDISKETKKEIISTLFLKSIFKTSFKTIPNIKWIYYTSNEDFIYVYPKYQFKDEKSFKKLYTFPFWQQAIPKNNKEHKLTITNLYKDAGGKGLMVTISIPIIYKDSFKGIISLDIGISTLSNHLKNFKIGSSFLIDEKNNIIASTKKFHLGKKFEKKDLVLKVAIVKDELYSIFTISNKELFWVTLYSSSGKILSLFLFLAMVYSLFYVNTILYKLKYLANTDVLTKLLNRRAMKKQVNKLISASKRYDNDLSFLILDIDFFKKVNDEFGHDVGDIVLVEISKIFRKTTRDSDVVARLGGEEFLIALYNTKIDDAFILSERIRNEISNMKIKNLDINLTISSGCAVLHKYDNLNSVLKRGDNLLYKAKNTGRNKTVKEEEN